MDSENDTINKTEMKNELEKANRQKRIPRNKNRTQESNKIVN